MSAPENRDPAEQLLDLLVYAPLGLLVEARELLPKLADKGRQRLGGQVTVARMIGELAVRQGQRRAEKLVQRFREQQRRPAPGGPAPSPAGPSATTNGQTAAPSAAATPSTAASPSASPATGAPPAAAAPPAASLAIPGYDTLSASQVVPRLEGLSAAELEAIRAYEEANRARKTILTRIEQLRGSGH